jgi:ABC-type cobalt transport system substrate-binding protein
MVAMAMLTPLFCVKDGAYGGADHLAIRLEAREAY